MTRHAAPSRRPDLRRLLPHAAIVAIVAAVVVFGAPAPAAGGGSTWDTEPPTVRPGDVVTVWAAVAWGHNETLGTPDHGPYHAYLRRMDGTDDDWAYGDVPDDAWWVAEIEVVLGPYDTGPWKVGPNHAIFTYTVPTDLEPGEYSIIHCNDPCTSTLGDITWGVLRVADEAGRVPAPPEPDEVAAEPATTTTTTVAPTTTTTTTTTLAPTTTTTAAPPTTTTSPPPPAPDGDANTPLLVGSAAGAIALGAAALLGRARRRVR